jgi:hypothetical protein
MPDCARHAGVSAASSCSRCSTALCDACLPFLVDERLACARCAGAASREGRPRWELAGAFLLAGTGILWSLCTSREYGYLALAAVALLGVAGWLVWPRGTKRAVKSRALEPGGIETVIDAGAGPYRGGEIRVRLPGERPVSGRSTALLLVGTFSATALALPFSLHLPRWAELEVVLASWGAAFLAVLVAILYRGQPVADDHRLALGLGDSAKSTASRGGRWILEIASGGADPEGCVGGFLLTLLLFVSLAAAWLLVELLVPVLFFLAYTILAKAIARAANDTHDCRGHFGRSLAWGLVWTSAYFVPFAFFVWMAHILVRARAG